MAGDAPEKPSLIRRFGWVVILLIVVVVTTVYIALQRTNGHHQTADSGLPVVSTATVRVSTVTEHLFEQGSVTTSDQAAIFSPVGGTVSPSIDVSVGQRVTAGEVVATTPDAAQAAQYSAAVAAASAQYTAWQDAQHLLKNADQQGIPHDASAYLQLQQAEQSAHVQYLTARASVVQAQASENASAIVSPISGSVVSVTPPYAAGSQAGSPMILIANLQRLQITANLSQGDSTSIAVGNPVTITSDAYPGRSWTGAIENVSPVAVMSVTGTAATVPVTIRVPSGFRIPLGFSVNLKVSGNHVRSLAIPYAALVENGAGTQVWVYSGGAVKLVTIGIGVTGDADVSVVSGLHAGETVVLNPSPNLYEGEAVTPS